MNESLIGTRSANGLFTYKTVQMSFLSFLFAFSMVCQAVAPPPLRHAISLYGEPRYPEGFSHFEYTNPDAPKRGQLKQAVIGQFDSLSPYVDRGTPAAGSHLQYDTLLARSWDEPLTKYGLIAEKIELDPDNNWVAFHVNPKARFNDGKPVTASDVKFSFDTLRAKGSAFYKHFYREIDRVEVTSTHRVLFVFNTNKNRELPLILGQMPVIPGHYWRDRDFSSPGLKVPVSSGPYRVKEIDPGRSIVYERDPNYWGRDLAVNRGRHNFDFMAYEYYRNARVASEALMKGDYDLKLVNDPGVWVGRLGKKSNKALMRKSQLIMETLKNGNPQTLTLTYNTRKAFLKDVRVRQAIGYALDFDWINRSYFHGMYRRANSLFAGTELAASSLPSPMEVKWLENGRKQFPAGLFTEAFTLPGDEAGLSSRELQGKALKLLHDAGWRIDNSQQVNRQGEKLELSVLLTNPEYERSMLSFRQGLKKLGIELHVKTVDQSQYIERVRNQDFELILHTFPHTPSPGTEQANHWSSQTAHQHGTRNLAGVELPIVDELTRMIPTANSRKELLSMVHALDRVLLWQHYVLPLWYPAGMATGSQSLSETPGEASTFCS